MTQVDVERAKQTRRRQQLRQASSGGSWLLGVLRSAILKASYAFTDHTRNILILSVFAFKARMSFPCLQIGIDAAQIELICR